MTQSPPIAMQPSLVHQQDERSGFPVRRSRHSHRRFALQLSVIVGCWLGANIIALQCIDAFEFREACHRFHISPQIARQFQARTLQLDSERFSGRSQVDYQLLPPRDLRSGERYPVVLYLHGAGERGDDGIQQLRSVPSWLATDENRERFPCYLISPQCPKSSHWNYRGRHSPRPVDELDIVHSILLDVLKFPSADSNRVYVIGYSMGGYGTWEFACRYPELVTAIVPVAGAGDPDRAYTLRYVPTWAVHGSDDNVVPVEGSDNMIEAIREAGGKPLYWRLAGVGHGALSPAIENTDEILCWLSRQSK